jgi:sigma-B regulation protein RsbU (phosphoserine phosphatase)
MTMAPSPRLLLCAAQPDAALDLRRPLEQAAFAVDGHTFADLNGHDPAAYRLILLDGTHDVRDALQCCRRLRGHIGDGFVPILLVTADPSPAARLASLECGADTYLLRPFEAAELLAQVRALLRIKDSHERLADRTAEIHRINKRLQSAYQQIDQELELARRIQESFLPQSLPEVPQFRFAVHYQPCGRVGGDFYDVFRLDEKHLGFYVADAMGHGVPASLLTIFVKKGVKAKEIFGKQYRLVPPSEVLQRLNRDMIEQELSENPFITMVYVLLNHTDGTLQFARSGHPYPLYLPCDGPPALWQVEGSLLGVFDTQFPTRTHRLRPGDKVLLYTDGTDRARFGDAPMGVKSVLAWATQRRERPIGELVERLSLELFAHGEQKDDLTVLGLEMMS